MPDCQVERFIFFFKTVQGGRLLIFIGVAFQVCDASTLNLAMP